ncbi:hypothetical protein AVEN_226269-1 [Araneus ventricosus]|uniref:Uncharacterized protein n=1 Tax=Araneus ventricosus TaxID=182803 RepID=A0A4Y2D998_ARAVE|nr:hypothetical protein AVEN_226269-1 [Araneus ventricosus]
MKLEFLKWFGELGFLKNLSVSRCFYPASSGQHGISVHTFCDASQFAYAVAVFVRIECADVAQVNLLAAKSRVAPVKTITISLLQLATDDADVHIVKTAIETHEKIKKQVVVIGQGVDLLVLPTALIPDYMDILILKEGNDKFKYMFYSSKDLRNSNLVIECKKSILFPHAISGCDTTSEFYEKGKLQAVQLFNHSKNLYMYTNICIPKCVY